MQDSILNNWVFWAVLILFGAAFTHSARPMKSGTGVPTGVSNTQAEHGVIQTVTYDDGRNETSFIQGASLGGGKINWLVRPEANPN